ncbi:MAG: FadR family transcriptional regulator [Spirochaetia bacterium]|uniref:HTH-type transcriptional regulator LutR n=1 Tax=bioreactor metagenome TaxID=1076179 RepID=A0A644TDR0_9ZZZZ|nr:FadR family transcriptional regulator [Spirochaetia bacterium]MDD3819911.1 FadR/GntR family transcriptional regulator [Spirochaetales bacterium]NLX46460.1 FadR family transcriptional regulator [Treponema sp.]VBB38605.1 putative GntR family transcriptional regulator [uncultured Spirochaetota bacterium]MCE1209976.1 FadR family transcriptional regulator [Spirochaetia bacterium]
MSVEPIKRVSVVEQAISKIYDLILSQNLKENDKLPPERQLSEMLGISRNSLREAIRVLDMLGVVRVDQGSGMVIDSSRVSDAVTKHLTFALLMNREKMNELFEARLVVETECASLAALRASESERALLHRTYQELCESRTDRPKSIALEIELHNIVARAAHNSVLEKILNSLKQILKESREATVPHTGVTPETVKVHERLIAAIDARDSRSSADIMREHIAAVADRMKLLQ